jgi:hypothetical protein
MVYGCRFTVRNKKIMVRHIALFQFKEEITQHEIDECFEALKGMQGRIPGIVGFEHGPYQSDEGLNEGFTHGFIMTFDSPQSRDAYLPHPIHEEVKNIVVPCLERIVVFDFTLP